MQLVSWVALLTLLVRDLAGMRSLDVAATVRKDRLHPRQAKLLETLSEYEIASPVRVDAGGEPLPTDVHFKRRRRSVDSASDPGPASASSSSTSSQEHYRLSAFGQHFLFNLTAQAGFIAPLFTVTLLGAPGVNQTKLYSEEETELKHCFYAGHVNTETAHTAVLSLCSGMLGTFRSHDGDYFIEPLLSMDEQEKEEEQNKPHIIYRRSLPQQEPSAGKHACGTSEHRSSHGRDRRKSSRRKWGGASRLAEDVAALQRGLAAKLPATLENQTGAPRDPRTRRRTKRFLSYPRFVEVMVVVDNKMVLYHGANLQHYVLTLMAIVASLYKDPSIGNLINIVIVNLVVIHDEQEGPPISFNAQTTLKNFCQWQHSQNSPGGIRHDTAVLITRQDICRAHDKCDTLGLAELGTICDPYRSCSISEDSGLSTAFTIAHELGHVFNMPHDDSNKCREEGVKSTQHVMAPTLTVDTNPWLWSKCSRKYITEFLDTGYGECLLNEPESRPYSLPPQLPGLFYSVNKQCEFIFGPGAELCPYMVQCRRLWCNVKRKDRACQTQHTPWADGTECEPGKHCKFGFCVPKEMEGPAVDGSWGSWSPYGACSRTCGGGIKMAIRECNRPEPKNGGKYCVGRRMKFKSCNMEPCLKQKRDFRDEQCAHFDGKHFNINGLLPTVRWVPKYSGILMKDRCKLFCRVAGSTAYYQLRDRVVDGTPCGQDTNDICVQGLCRQAGCDHVLNSKARRDKCGVCGGDNSSCKTVAGTFNTVHYGYNAVVRIPAGATNIDVRQHSFSGKSEDDNYLALSNSKGEFLLNGDFVVTMSKREIRVGNAMIEYSGSDNVVERINSTDRMDQELLLQVLSVGKLYNPDVRYSFNVPIEGRLQQFYWNSHGPWQACSKPCQGERKRKPVCTRESDQLPVSDQRCDRLPQPEPITEACSTDCDLRWHVGGRSECSAQCGLGYRTLDIYCAKYSRLDGKVEKVDDGFCSNHPKPTNQEKCSGECNMGVWRYSAWTECSKSCDGGSQRRRAICVNSRNDVLDDSKCAHQEKVTTQRCNELPCPQWKSGDWSECLVTCGKGRRHRQVWCQFGEDHASDKICNPEAKPASTQPCQQSECASWQAGPWGQCSVTCGQGYQLRAVKCVLGTYMAVLDDSDCNAATRPTDTQDCEAAPCQPPPAAPGSRRSSHGTPRTQWRFGSWTPCSATCGKGTRMRYVSCRGEDGSVAHEDACTSLPRPAASEECAVTPCGQWKASDWSVCSVTCGQGRATRQVVCVNYSDHVVSQSECDLDYIPETHQDCSLSPCPRWTPDRGLASYPFQNEDFRPRGASPSRTHVLGGNQWRTGPWGACSSTCAGGSQRRVVVCQDENGYPARDCVERIKPDEQRACEAGPCPQWVFGSWGECSKPCGGGVRTRLVLCQRASGERFPDLSCDVLEKPLDREQCGAHSCPDGAWSAGPWSPCSVSCGRGHKQRNVYCMAKDGSHLESDFCEHLAKPHGHRRCRGGRCPRWKAGAWSQCSVSCGRGVQQRHVACHIGTQKAARESECNSVSRPEAERDCQAPPCPLRTWRAEQWQECSKTCGEGSRFRRVVCVDEDQGELHSALCSTSQRPPDRESCSLQPCEYVWITGEWSECSVTCGKGYKQRLVSCSEIYTGKENYEYSYQTTVHCPGTQPPSVQPCYLQECPVLATWRVGNWGSCSVSCGVGEMHRSVQCLTNEDQPSHLCPADLKPEEQKTCHSAYNCEVPQNCKEVRDLSGASEDGEYVLIVRGKLLKIFCAGMQSSHPKEYVSLIHGDSENFSEVYGHRLHNPTECPYNGSRRDDCRCRKDYTAAGLSSFQKIRIDLGSMQIITTDLQFARTSEGHPVPFATAGDCYSAAKCPQGRFSINLDGTGLSVTESARWISQGNYAVSDIKRAPDGTRVVGKCGGYCGKCTPSSGTGLEVRVL